MHLKEMYIVNIDKTAMSMLTFLGSRQPVKVSAQCIVLVIRKVCTNHSQFYTEYVWCKKDALHHLFDYVHILIVFSLYLFQLYTKLTFN